MQHREEKSISDKPVGCCQFCYGTYLDSILPLALPPVQLLDSVTYWDFLFSFTVFFLSYSGSFFLSVSPPFLCPFSSTFGPTCLALCLCVSHSSVNSGSSILQLEFDSSFDFCPFCSLEKLSNYLKGANRM